MPHVLIAGKLHPAGLARIEAAAGYTFDYVEEISEPSYAALIDKADALVIRTQPLTGATLAKATRLKLVSRHGVGFDSVDLPALNQRRIPLCIAGDTNSLSVAEHSMTLILACAKQVLRADRAVREGAWKWRDRLEATEISGKRLLIVGYGRAGAKLGRMAEGFDMDVRAFDPYLAARGWPPGQVSPVATLAEGLAWADIVSLNVPKAEKPLLGMQELALLRPGAIVVNTARGGVVDEAALADALTEGHVAAAGLDVFDDEPPATSHPLLAFDQVILSPHIAGVTKQASQRMAVTSVQNVIDFFAGRLDPSLIVNKEF